MLTILKYLILFAAFLLVFFLNSRKMDTRASSTFSLTSATTQELQELLDQRGVPNKDLKEKSQLIDLANETGIYWPEVHDMRCQMEAADAATDTILMSGKEYSRKLEKRRSKVAWLVMVMTHEQTTKRDDNDESQVLTEDGDVTGATPEGEKNWQQLRHKMALLGVRTALLDCRLDETWCEQHKWTSYRFHLSLHTGSDIKPDVITYTSPVMTKRRIFRWVHQNLDHNVERIRGMRVTSFRDRWLTVKSREIHAVLLTDQPTPPPFFSALSIHLSDTVSFAWVQIQSRDEVARLTDGLDLDLDFSQGRLSFPIILVVTKEGVYRYGQREFECVSFDRLRMFLLHLHPFSMASLFFGLVIVDVLLASMGFFLYKEKNFNLIVSQVFNDFIFFFAVFSLVWALLYLVSFDVSSTGARFLVSLKRHFAMTSLGDLLRHDYVMLSGNPFRILPGLIVSLLGLSLVPILRQIAQP